MKVIIPLGGFGTRMRPHTWSRPKPLIKVAGNTVIGHILEEMADVCVEQVIFVVGYKGQEIEAWIRENYPALDAHFVIQEDPLGQAHAIWLCRHFLDESDVIIAFGDGIIRADFAAIPEEAPPEADAVFLVKEVEDPSAFGVVALDEDGFIKEFIEKPTHDKYRLAIVGVYWFRDGRFLRDALDVVIEEGHMTLGEYFLADAFQVMLQGGARLAAKQIDFWLDAGKPENALQTNQRLLATIHASPDAVERSYAEDFTVLPPVYLHPTAVVDRSVIGPYVSVDAGVTIRHAVIRNSIIDAGAHIEDCILEGALVGENARVTGQAKSLFVGDDSQVEIG